MHNMLEHCTMYSLEISLKCQIEGDIVEKFISFLESWVSPMLWPINKCMFKYIFTSQSRAHQSVIQILMVLSWKHVNQVWDLLESCKVGGHGLSIPKAFVETSLSLLWLTHRGQDPHPNTSQLFFMSFWG